MKLSPIILAGLLGLAVAPLPEAGLAPQPAPDGDHVQLAQGMTCFFRRETVSGANRLCVYDCMGSEAAMTISSAQICPGTMTR